MNDPPMQLSMTWQQILERTHTAALFIGYSRVYGGTDSDYHKELDLYTRRFFERYVFPQW